MTLRLAVVGAGVMGRHVAEAVRAASGVVLTGIVDPAGDRAAKLAARHGVPAFPTLADVTDGDVADAVYLGLPHHLHHGACLQAAAGGLHMLIDKPLCNSLDEADDIIRACEAADVTAMVGFSYRFRAEWMAAREAMSSGEIGPAALVVETLIEASTATPAWYWDAAAGGGVLQLQAHHCFDRIEWLLGDPIATVSARVAGRPGHAEQTATVQALTRGGVLISIGIGFGRAYDATSDVLTVIEGDLGRVRLAGDRRLTVLSETGAERWLDGSADPWLVRELTTFAAMCRGEATTAPGLTAGRAALRTALAAAESAARGGIVVNL